MMGITVIGTRQTWVPRVSLSLYNLGIFLTATTITIQSSIAIFVSEYLENNRRAMIRNVNTETIMTTRIISALRVSLGTPLQILCEIIEVTEQNQF
jgi:hypothetical protein